ncbi:MAG: bacteriohemerythrin [Candidatus Polarisedimenticolaceae bacterium]|nr:bacteriohemerythrin [Candidatus Polarisedimenticolaceae bacterium]
MSVEKYRHYLIFWISILTLGVLSTIGYSFLIAHRMVDHCAPQLTNIVQIKLEVTAAHLWFEGAITDDIDVDINDVWLQLDQAEQHARIMLGEESRLDRLLVVLDESVLHRQVERVLMGIDAFRRGAQERWLLEEGSGIGSYSDQRLDLIFNDIMFTADNIEGLLDRSIKSQMQQFHLLQTLLIVMVMILGIVVAMSSLRYGRERQSDIQTLRESEEKFRAIFQSSVVSMIVVVDGDGLITEWNLGAERAFGYNTDEAVGQPLTLLMPERYRAQHSKGFLRAVREGGLSYGGSVHELAGLRKNGQEFPLELTLGTWQKSGKLYFSAIILDITARKQSEEALREERSFADSLLKTAQSIILVLDKDGRIVRFNPYMEALSGYSLVEMQGKDWFSNFLPKHDQTEVKVLFNQMIASAQIMGHVNSIITKGGELREIEWHNTAQRDADGDLIGVLAIGHDVTSRNHTERLLRRTQKMDALGQLTGGIAHDFNNILGIILGNVDLLKSQIADNKSALNRLWAIEKTAQRAAKLTKQLLGFSCDQAAQTTATSINRLISEMDDLIRRSITPEVEVEQQLSDELWHTNIDPGDFQDALLNLVINARDAMPDGGRLTLETNNCNLVLDSATENSGQYVELIVSDSGMGIPVELQERIFEPFFTTKGQGEGTGLGLSMIFGFVQRSGGQIKVYSELGVGTTFRLYLPRAMEKETPLVTEPLCEQTPVLLEGAETILVVDDEEELLMLAQDSLQRLGYRVVTADDASQALAQLAEDSTIKLLFSDVVMPGGMNGYDLAEQAVATYQGLKVLLTSGYTEKAVLNNGQAHFAANLLSKPYSQAELAQRVRAVLSPNTPDIEVPPSEPVPPVLLVHYNAHPPTEWSEMLSVGVDALDSGHQALLRLLKQSQQAAENGGEGEVSTILVQLWNYSKQHFQREEAVMLACAYPELNNHQQVHQLLIKQIERMVRKRDKDELSSSEVMMFLNDWWGDHILGMDRAFAPYCKGKKKLIEQALVELGITLELTPLADVKTGTSFASKSEERVLNHTSDTLRLIIVDDEMEVASLIAEVAESVGYKVDIANSVKQFQQCDDVQLYDVIIIDLIMPDTDGIELIKILADQGSRAAIIAISGYDKGVLKAAGVIAEKSGLDMRATLSKPLNLHDLRALLQEIILDE